MELRVKDLQRYLMSNKISTKDCVGKFFKERILRDKGYQCCNEYFEVDHKIHSILRIFEHLI